MNFYSDSHAVHPNSVLMLSSWRDKCSVVAGSTTTETWRHPHFCFLASHLLPEYFQHAGNLLQQNRGCRLRSSHPHQDVYMPYIFMARRVQSSSSLRWSTFVEIVFTHTVRFPQRRYSSSFSTEKPHRGEARTTTVQ